MDPDKPKKALAKVAGCKCVSFEVRVISCEFVDRLFDSGIKSDPRIHTK